MDLDEERYGERSYIYNPDRFTRYVNNTRFEEPHKEITNLVKQMEPGYAIEFGVGAGNDAVFLLENGWNVTGIDLNKPAEQEVLNRIKSEDEKQRFNFINSSFEDLKYRGIKKNYYDLAYAFDSLSFCDKSCFLRMWEVIASSIKPGGILVCNLFGVNDDFNIPKTSMTFFTRDKIIELIKKDYELDEKNLHQFKEFKEKTEIANGSKRYEHSFKILVKKIKRG